MVATVTRGPRGPHPILSATRRADGWTTTLAPVMRATANGPRSGFGAAPAGRSDSSPVQADGVWPRWQPSGPELESLHVCSPRAFAISACGLGAPSTPAALAGELLDRSRPAGSRAMTLRLHVACGLQARRHPCSSRRPPRAGPADVRLIALSGPVNPGGQRSSGSPFLRPASPAPRRAGGESQPCEPCLLAAPSIAFSPSRS
jgi:hypothetical protein